MRVRINKKLAVKKDGIDMAVFYAKAGTIDLDETKDARIKNSHVRIKLVGKLSNEHISELSNRYSISKSEVVRRCLKWLEDQPSYYPNFPNDN